MKIPPNQFCGRIAVSRARSFLVYLFDMPASFADETTSHSTKPASWQVAGYARLLALHSKILNLARFSTC